MAKLNLPVDMSNVTVTQTAATATDYWNLHARGYTEVEGPATASLTYDELTPAQKRARTLAEKKAAEEAGGDDSGEGDSAENHETAGDATGDES